MYAIVDIETTGGFSEKNHITEIAIIIHDGKKEIERFTSLVNPQVKIPSFITSLTGITDHMVEKAPLFSALAPEIHRMLEGKVFVAHNVNFDYSFVRKELLDCGINFQSKKLCTVRLSRKIIPNLSSYNLGNVCANLNITIFSRHRALGDAEATVKLFEMLQEKDCENILEKSLKKNSREALLPPNLPKEQFDEVPEQTGIYYFYNKKGKVIYVGKAKNLKARIISHFSGKSETRQKDNFINNIYSLGYEICGNEFLALLLECHEIQHHWPIYNNTNKKGDFNYGIYLYEDLKGYYRLCANKIGKSQKPLLTFRFMSEARSFLVDRVMEFKLCPKLCGLQETVNECMEYKLKFCNGACIGNEDFESYNDRLSSALKSFESTDRTFVILGEGRTRNEKSVVLVEKGNYLGYGYIGSEESISHFNDFKPFINPQKDNQEIQKIIYSHIRNFPDSIVNFKTPVNEEAEEKVFGFTLGMGS